jgi:hypothetical protein
MGLRFHWAVWLVHMVQEVPAMGELCDIRDLYGCSGTEAEGA